MATVQPEGIHTDTTKQLQAAPIITSGSVDSNNTNRLEDNLSSDSYTITSNSTPKSTKGSADIKSSTRNRQGGRTGGNDTDSRRYHTTGVIEDIKVILLSRH